MRKLRAGIVGCGGIANGKHLPAMQKSGLYEVVAFCDIIIERAQETKEKFGTEDAKVFEDYQSMKNPKRFQVPDRTEIKNRHLQRQNIRGKNTLTHARKKLSSWFSESYACLFLPC